MAWAPSRGMEALVADLNYDAPAKRQTTSHIAAENYNTPTKRHKIGAQVSPTSHGTRSSNNNKTGGRTDRGPGIEGKRRQSRKTELDRAKEEAAEKVAVLETKVAILQMEVAALKRSTATLEQDMAGLKESQAKGKRKRGNDTANKRNKKPAYDTFRLMELESDTV